MQYQSIHRGLNFDWRRIISWSSPSEELVTLRAGSTVREECDRSVIGTAHASASAHESASTAAFEDARHSGQLPRALKVSAYK